MMFGQNHLIGKALIVGTERDPRYCQERDGWRLRGSRRGFPVGALLRKNDDDGKTCFFTGRVGGLDRQVPAAFIDWITQPV